MSDPHPTVAELVARSNALGAPPRCRWPRTTWRVSFFVISSIRFARRSPMPPRRTLPNSSFPPDCVVKPDPSFGWAPSAQATIV